MKYLVFPTAFLILLLLYPALLRPNVLEQNARIPLATAIEDVIAHGSGKGVIGNPSPSELAQEAHDINDIFLMVDNQGLVGYDQVTGNGEGFFPRGTGNNYVFATGLWFGAYYDADDDGLADKVFTQGCSPLGWDSQFREGRNDQDRDDPLARVFDSTDQDDLSEWPPQFSDSLGGDPVVFSNQDLVTTYTTKDILPGFGFQIPLEVNQRSMAVVTPDLLDQVIFFVFQVTNWGDEVLEDSWVGFAGDFDIGNVFSDDLTSVIFDRITLEGDTVTLDVVYQWDSDFMETNFTDDPGFVGISFLFGPGDPDDGIDNDGDGIIDESPVNGIDDDGDGITDEWDEEDVIGLVNFSQFCNSASPCDILDPNDDSEGYDLLACNTPGSQYQCLEITEPGNARFMLSSGPFDWLPGQTRTIALAYIFSNAVGSPDRLEWVGDPPRPDPNDPALSEFVQVTEMAREFFLSLYPPLSIGEDFEGNSPNIPRSLSLYQNFPNPFNPSTTIRFDIPGETGPVPVRVLIYDLRGRLIRVLLEENCEPGRYQVHWDGRDNKGQYVPSGVYLYSFVGGEFTSTRKMTVVR